MFSTENNKNNKLYHKSVPFWQNMHYLYGIFTSIE